MVTVEVSHNHKSKIAIINGVGYGWLKGAVAITQAYRDSVRNREDHIRRTVAGQVRRGERKRIIYAEAVDSRAKRAVAGCQTGR